MLAITTQGKVRGRQKNTGWNEGKVGRKMRDRKGTGSKGDDTGKKKKELKERQGWGGKGRYEGETKR